jgi:RNA polymerase sigma-70 factor (ECF subfamily)
VLPARANGQPAVVFYAWDEERACFLAREVGVLTLDDGRIGELTAFRSPRSHVPFGLPAELPGP